MLSTASTPSLQLPLVSPASRVFAVQFAPTGPAPAQVMIVGEAPGEKEVEYRKSFVGASGYLLDECLREAGLSRSQCFVTNVLRERPPGNDLEEAGWATDKKKKITADHQLVGDLWVDGRVRFGLALLQQEIALVQPTVIVALGNLALWALTGEWSVAKWRSSILSLSVPTAQSPTPAGGTAASGSPTTPPPKVIPALHPSAVLREYSKRGLLVHDLKRVRTEMERGLVINRPDYRFIIRPNYDQACLTLRDLLARADRAAETPGLRIRLAADIETRAGHTACLGIAWSRTEAICIPWMCVERLEGYWSLEEETELVALTRQLLSHPGVELIWQNGAYDHQYEHRWHFFLPGLGWDTMVAHHAMFSISPKSLDHLSSLYCDYHRYWKDDGRLWDPGTQSEDQLWSYNCEDCVRTYEIAEEEQGAVAALTPTWPKLPSVVDFQHRLQPAVVRMMLRGVRSDDLSRANLSMALRKRIAEIEEEMADILGFRVNINSPKQMLDLFYGVLGQTEIKKRQPSGFYTPTVDDEALSKIAAREPALRRLVARIQALRSASKFQSTYLEMPRDMDGRLRCSYNVAGTKTYRFSSSENAFGSGGNLQNIPTGDESEDAIIPLPNIKNLFLFDPGMTGFDLDGDSADLRIVTGESGCRQMQAYFAARVKPYVEIAKEFYRDQTITKHHPSYKRMKALCHGSNYGGEPAGLSERIGLPVHDIERMQKWYFGMCSEIKVWQEDIKAQFNGRGYIENPFGYRLWRWDRPSRKLDNEALAWTPQSTVGILINHILLAIDQQLPAVELLLQVHDSLTGQYPTDQPGLREEILRIADSIVIPCKSGPITVPSGMKTAITNWGDCE